jgi:hypothetical protein
MGLPEDVAARGKSAMRLVPFNTEDDGQAGTHRHCRYQFPECQ